MTLHEPKYIDEDKVPIRFGRCLDWDRILSEIPKGQALVLENVNPPTTRRALLNRQKQGLFKNLYAVQRGKTVFIVNPNEGSSTERGRKHESEK